ncbi:hypothetical protein ACHAWC_011464 [Mediolabrus comicus]
MVKSKMIHRRRATASSSSVADGSSRLNGAFNRSFHNFGSSETTSRRRHFKQFDLWAASLCLLVCLVVQLEFLAYQTLFKSDRSIKVDNNSEVHGVQSMTRRQDGLAAVLSSNKQQEQQRQQDEDRNEVSIPANQPTSSHKSSQSYEPTNGYKRWRVKEAIDRSNANSQFWNGFEPEKISPPTDSDDLPPVIAYVTTLTKCSVKKRGSLDGAAVLLHSIRRNSWGWTPMQEQSSSLPDFDYETAATAWPKYGGRGGRYRYRAYVIVDPMASPNIQGRVGDCARYMQSIGWTVLHRPPLVPLFEIDPKYNKNDAQPSVTFDDLQRYGYVGVQRPKTGETALKPGEHPNKLRLMMHNDGCCGYNELLKLHVYGLVEHPLAVHFDFDSLVLRPMDDLFDAMLGKQTATSIPIAKLPHSKPVDFSKPIDAAFTRDYNSVKHPTLNSPVGYQGGFLAVRPSLAVLERYRKILQRGEFALNPRTGWGGRHGNFYGDLTFQGILPYYYEDIAPPGEHNELELDRCVFNQMADNPRQSTYKFPRATPIDPKVMGFGDTKRCRDGRKDCSDTDCQRTHPKDSITAHFTFCKKPWDCSIGLPGTVALETCLGLLSEWYGVRRELEDWWMLPPADPDEISGDYEEVRLNNQRSFYWNQRTINRVMEKRQGVMDPDLYRGYCDATGSEAYHNLMGPDGLKAD